MPKHTRRYDVVKDIIDSNDYQKISEQWAAKVKALLSSYRDMTPKVAKGLKEVGFEITHDGGHYKTIYYGDDRYRRPRGHTQRRQSREKQRRRHD